MTYSAGQTPANCFDGTARTPWNNTIFPGNYVCHLNSYRNQGVNAYPGLEFFSLVGALVVLPIENTSSNVLNSSLQLPAAAYGTQILSPDLGPAITMYHTPHVSWPHTPSRHDHQDRRVRRAPVARQRGGSGLPRRAGGLHGGDRGGRADRGGAVEEW